ncbi:MAG: Tetratricopeptide repeat protein [Deltaproteobacteria bacterium]|nr:Tetratricopeptide repeat protein [Deltaproteobacteria bacterium]
MVRDLPDVDQSIEEGLTLYGQGDLDGALQSWERALAVDPENPQANSYVDYVRQNYELLTSEVSKSNSAGPFAITEGEPEYQIEILPGELIAPTIAPLYMDPLDEGWFMEDEGGPHRSRTVSADPPMETLELEADEPPAEPAQPISFDDATREYPGGPPVNASRAGVPSQVAAELTPSGFGGAQDHQTPGVSAASGFNTQLTDVRQRDLGFVQMRDPGLDHRPASVGPSDLVITLRTPVTSDLGDDTLQQLRPAGALDDLAYEDPPTTERTLGASAAALLDSLPVPTGTTRGADQPVWVPSDLLAESKTRDFPEPSSRSQPPANATARQPGTDGVSPPRIEQLPGGARSNLPKLGSAPTLDLGIREMAAMRADDEPTNMRARPMPREGTRADAYLAFDPIDARTAQILDDVEVGAPEHEAKEDRTRRRITALFDRALIWSRNGELEHAVAAIDLALSEDPNSALAQKLIHRNRDTMMSVFQAFLGDLQRQPLLARPLHELANAPISPRAAFLLSRVDGTLSLDEILDVSGMPRLEAYRYLCQLYLRGILR